MEEYKKQISGIMKCIICKGKAKHRFSPDLDIKGIGACREHKLHVQVAYTALLANDEKMFWKLIKEYKDYKEEVIKWKRKIY